MANRLRVYRDTWDPVTYKGDVDATVSPNGELLIIENQPDVGNVNNGQPVKELRAIFADGSWDKVEIDE